MVELENPDALWGKEGENWGSCTDVSVGGGGPRFYAGVLLPLCIDHRIPFFHILSSTLDRGKHTQDWG